MPAPRFTLVRSRLVGNSAHRDQLKQLLAAPEAYWMAQTPVGRKPVASFALDAAEESFTELVLAGDSRSEQLRTLLVLMTSRMPGLTVEFKVDGDPGGWTGLRLARGKLEGCRAAQGEPEAWRSIPHHSTLIGCK